MAITDENDDLLSRSQRRLLRRVYNGRSVPIIVDGRPFLTYKEASRYLQSIEGDARESAYAQMKEQATPPPADGAAATGPLDDPSTATG
jgi:hypothetical protein